MQSFKVFAVSPKRMQDLGIDRATTELFARQGATLRFTPEELVNFTLLMLTGNTWRFAISFGKNAGLSDSYVRQP